MTRTRGLVDSLAGLGPNDHASWFYRSDAEFVGAAVEFLHDAERLGQRAIHLADRPRSTMLSDLEPLGDVERMEADGALLIGTLDAVYPGSRATDPSEQLASYQQAIDEAIAAGFRGIRVAVEATALAADPTRMARWEQIADQLMARQPMSALCAYDARVTDPDTIAGLGCRHPVRNGGSPFSLTSESQTVVLEGEVDAFVAHHLRDALDAAPYQGDPVIDLEELRFIDAAGVTSLAAAAQVLARRGQQLVVRRPADVVRRMWALLDLDRAGPVRWDPEPRAAHG